MTFTVVYREKNGAKAEVEIKAANRAECFAQCKARGIVPVSVKEGASQKRASRPLRGEASAPAIGAPYSNGQDARCPSGDKPQSSIFNRKYSILAGSILLVAAIGGVWWWLAGARDARPYQPPADPPKSTKSVREVKPKAPPKQEAKPVAAKPKVRAGAAVAKTSHAVGVQSVVTNENGFIITTEIDASGKTNILTTTVKPPTFTNAIDQLVAAAIGGAYDKELAPLPTVGPEGDAALRAALKQPIVDLPGDTAEIRLMKQGVREARESMVQLLDKGLTVNEILTQHQELWNENARVRNEMKAEYAKVLRSGDAEAAEAFRQKVNEVFAGMGIVEIREDEVSLGGKKRKKIKEVQE